MSARRVHVKKCHPGAFEAIRDGRKTFEYRKEDDCEYQVNDVIVLLEYNPPNDEPMWDDPPHGYTGEVERRRVTYVLRGEFGVPEGYAVLSLGKWEPNP
jgi:hypothetical protein